nr:TonB family protein [Campylobacterota bacterium]
MLYIPNPIIEDKSTITEENSNLASILGATSFSQPQQQVRKTSKIQKLYGNSFDTFTPTQQKFIVKNLDSIHRITQNTLTRRGYPEGALAARTGQEGVNIVSFDLHPNGNISNLRLKKRVGYRALDDNTLETIRSAYKDYPYPAE